MIRKLTYIESGQANPYGNLALEETLLLNCGEEECILYLWQNQNTIVIGRNQNAWKECLVDKLKEDGGHLVRRLSGGGAVYHDLGNLNFTFLVRKGNYSLEKQLSVIIRALDKLGINAEKSGRNDILVDGRKFSGNAFYEQGDFCYHHGTLMVDVNLGELSKYLTVSAEKLKSNGVDSVKSRVTNIKACKPDLTIPLLQNALREAFEDVYQLSAEVDLPEGQNQKQVCESRKKFESWEWIYGRKIVFEHEISNRFSWGSFGIQFQVKSGKIQEAGVYSDAMEQKFVSSLSEYLKQVTYSKTEIARIVGTISCKAGQEEQMRKEICSWLLEVEL